MIELILTRRFLYILTAGVVIVAASYFVGLHLMVFILYNLTCFTVLILDYFLSPSDKEFKIERIGDTKLSIYESEKMRFEIYNITGKKIYLEIKDEFPDFYFESHEKIMKGCIMPHSNKVFEYEVIPKKRGAYKFGNIHVRYKSNLKLCMKQFKLPLEREYKVYPNLKDLRKYRLAVYNSKYYKTGQKPFKLLGKGSEFESLREYVFGDEYRRINWKATAKENKPIVNQYEPEKNQHVYMMIDTGRPMSFSVRGYKKLDLAINTALLLSDIVNQNGDKSGLMIFNTEVENLIMPGKGYSHRSGLMEALYHIEHTKDTSNYEEAFYYFKRKERRRSLIFLFTDFETSEEAEDMFKTLSILSKNNIVVIMLMKDERLKKITSMTSENEHDIFNKGVALEILRERKTIIQKLNSRGIMCIECCPEELAVNAINKYLYIKNRMFF
ncbi:Uncharacterized conserved protein, DUF58 family, contains vWF domain [Maledivibacter halophilus]|uniref:Uncharacterized conserved protein, DUF58 family, contains vWF domain n=1 Tax=Maledivibacter halophilus TaxID=36842 RepID=A0A1T5J6V9_9FIRM|nr:Uncharacterized conserved protein, DUF58 family, contains vWF domain [Maledivibacter halophilus]